MKNTSLKLLLSFCILHFIFCNLNSLHAQNLVPNGDFELGPDSTSSGWTLKVLNNCQAILGMSGPDYWIKEKGSPDRLVNGTIPCNWDTNHAQSGNAYINLWGSNFPNVIEEGKAHLLSNMQQDTFYLLSYWIRSETYRHQQPPIPYSAVAFILNDSVYSTFDTLISPCVLDSLEWEYHDTIFSSKSNFTEIHIMAYDTSISQGSASTEVDNVSLQKLSTVSVKNYSIDKTINVYPVPASEILFINSYKKINNIRIYDMLGKEVNSFMINTEYNPISINISQLTNGFYFLQIITDNKIINKKIILN